MNRLYLLIFSRDLLPGIFHIAWAEAFLRDGRSLASAAIAYGVYCLSTAIFEVPTGLAADRFGRKRVTVVGLTLNSLGFLLLAFFDTSAIRILGFGLAGIGATCVSGASAAWAYEVGGRTTKKSRTDLIFSFELISRFAMVAGAWLGVFALEMAPKVFWAVAAGSGFLGVFVAGFLVEKDDLEERKQDIPQQSFSERLEGWKVAVHSTALLAILMGSLFFGLESGVRFIIWQPYVAGANKGALWSLGAFQTILAVVRFTSTYYTKPMALRPEFKSLRWIVVTLLLFAFAEGVAALLTPFWFFMLIWCAAIAGLGLYFPLKETLLNDHAPERYRASVISLDSMVQKIATAAASFLVAVLLGWRIDGGTEVLGSAQGLGSAVAWMWWIGAAALVGSAGVMWKSGKQVKKV